MQNKMVPHTWEIALVKKATDNISIEAKIPSKSYLELGKFPVIDQGKNFISGYANISRGLITDIPVIIFGDHTRVLKYVDFPFLAGADGIKVLKAKKFILPKLLFYFLQAIELPDRGYARHFQYLEKSAIPVPPMAEQKRIVKKIEELFGVIDEQVKRLEATQEALVSYRQSILQQAFSGKLHKTTDWKKITLQEAVDINPKTVLPALSDSEIVSFLPMPAVQEESLEYAEQKSSFGKVKKGYTKFRDEDVLFAKITPCMENGKGCIVHNLSHGIGFGSTEFHVLRCHKDVSPKFIYYFVIRRTFRAEAKNKMSGAVGQQRVPAEFLKEYSFTRPSLPEQKAIVKKIENAFAFADKAQAAITGALEQAKQLKQSILKRAFEGKLIPQDPNDKPVDLTQIKKDKHK